MNVYGRKQSVIFLEFNTIVGTDSICFIDGRLNNYNMEQRIIEQAKAIRKYRPNLPAEPSIGVIWQAFPRH